MKHYLVSYTLAILAIASPVWAAGVKPKDAAQRQILICTSDNASPAIKQAADELDENPPVLLKALQSIESAGPTTRQSSESVLKDYNLAAYNHLIVVGLKSVDPLVDKVWEHYATVDESAKSFYAQGWGYLSGDVGYIESDRNPFLHTRKIKQAPFETVLVKITGTDEAGVLAAVKAFSDHGLLNGVVPAGDWKRTQSSLLDLDPFLDPPTPVPPKSVRLKNWQGKEGDAPLVGWMQVGANEYRAYIDRGGAEPVRVWRFKYLEPNALDRAGINGWLAGLHRIAWGNAVMLAQFHSDDEAAAVAKSLANGWTKSKSYGKLDVWEKKQPATPKDSGQPNEDEILPNPPGEMTVLASGSFVILSALEPAATKQWVDQFSGIAAK